MNRDAIYGVKAAVFDLDGTLFDSARLWSQIDIAFLKKRGLYPTPEYKRALAALGNMELARFTVDYYRLSDTPEALVREWTDMALFEYEHNIKLFDGAKEYVLDVYERGITVVAVTSLVRELAEPCLARGGLLDIMKSLITADETGLSKTSPEIYRYAAKTARAETKACVAFDDVARAVQSAKLAGMTTVAVRDAVGEGDCGQFEYADYVVDSVSDAPRLFAEDAPTSDG